MKEAIIATIIGGLTVELVKWLCSLMWHKLYAMIAAKAEC